MTALGACKSAYGTWVGVGIWYKEEEGVEEGGVEAEEEGVAATGMLE